MSRAEGIQGEAIVARYLREQGYRLAAHGYRSRYGEIDLIAEDESWLIFAEVKLRRSAGYGAAREFVDARKQERLRKTALMWLEAHETLLQPRFDVIEIYAPEGIATRRPAVRHIEDAFI